MAFLTFLVYISFLAHSSGETCGTLKARYQGSDCCHQPEEHDASYGCITEQEIQQHQSSWRSALESIGEAWRVGGCANATSVASAGIPLLYQLEGTEDRVLFKPSFTFHPHTFRNTFAETLSYFVGNCSEQDHIQGDAGFALGGTPGNTNLTTYRGWTNTTFSNFQYLVNGSFCHAAVAQGQLTVTSGWDGSVSTVDKTFVYVKSASNDGLRLVTHHSSVIVSPP